MRIYLVKNSLDNYILVAFPNEEQAIAYIEDLNNHLENINEETRYVLATTWLAV